MSVQAVDAWARTAGLYAIAWWSAAILDRPHEHWWAHGIVAIPLGLLVAACQSWIRRRRHGVPAMASPLPARLAWGVSGLVAFVAFVLAGMRNTPAQYAAAAVISALALYAARDSSYQSGAIRDRRLQRTRDGWS